MIQVDAELKGYQLKPDANKDLKSAKWDKNVNNEIGNVKMGWTSGRDRDRNQALSGKREPDVTTQKGMKNKSNENQKISDWLFDDISRIQVTSAVKKGQNDSVVHNSLDDFVVKDENLQNSKAKNCNVFDEKFGNQKRGIRSSSIAKEWLLTESEKEAKFTGKDSDLVLEDNWKGKTTKRERRRGQSLDDAADELRRLVGHDF